MIIRQLVIIVLLSAGLGLGVNVVSPNKIPLVGDYRNISGGNEPVVPPDAQKGDPPFIPMSVAELEFDAGTAVFVDARDPEEFACGTIPGSVNIPFDYLPEEDLAGYFDSLLAGSSRETHLIAFCSGEECDLSLHLARNFQAEGYINVSIFFGGAREWETFGRPLERRADCGD